MRAAEEVFAGADLADRIDRLTVLGEINAREQRVHHARLVYVEDEFLVAHREAAFEPAGRVQHEIHAAKAGWQQGVGGFRCRLRVRDLGAAEPAAGAERHAQTSRECGHHVEHQRGLGGAEGGRARLHRHARGKAAHHYGRARVHQLHEGHAGQRFCERLRGGAGHGDR